MGYTMKRETLLVLEQKKNNWRTEVCILDGGTFSIREWGPNDEMGRGINLSTEGKSLLREFLNNEASQPQSVQIKQSSTQQEVSATEQDLALHASSIFSDCVSDLSQSAESVPSSVPTQAEQIPPALSKAQASLRAYLNRK